MKIKPLRNRNANVQSDTMLTRREQEVLKFLAAGLSNKEIGEKLGLSSLTVRNHLAHVFKKLQVRSRTEAVLAHLRSERKL
jgi:DNA-binding NarL/FixJ family response regulator